jgi:hypothetical protein
LPNTCANRIEKRETTHSINKTEKMYASGPVSPTDCRLSRKAIVKKAVVRAAIMLDKCAMARLALLVNHLEQTSGIKIAKVAKKTIPNNSMGRRISSHLTTIAIVSNANRTGDK